MNINNLALAGGIFFIFTFVHFVVDWIFQTHKEAMAKHNNPLVRARHCLIYTLGFIPIMFLFKFEAHEIYISSLILFFSHFVEDTYIPVFLWVKYVRRPAEMYPMFRLEPFDEKAAFGDFARTPLGKILIIVVDQLIHMIFLIPLVWMALN